MLLSSVNFIAKPKVGKSTKTKEAKTKVIEVPQPTVCEECRKEEEEQNTIFKFPESQSSSGSTSSGYASLHSLDIESYPGDRVTVATGDDLCLSVDQFFYSIGLKDEAKADCTCIFRKKVLESKTLPNGSTETVVFVLDCDREFYLTTTGNRSLELNHFFNKPSLECPDERTFVVFHTANKQALVQPALHKNFYLHHLDQSLSVQPLDLNWRCPEEYFFHFNAVPEPVRPRKPKVCTHMTKPTGNDTSESCEKNAKCGINTQSFNRGHYVNSVKVHSNKMIEIPVAKSKSSKNKNYLSDLFLGCFSGKSHALVQS